MTSKAITIRAETDTIARIDELAKAMDRSRNYVVNQAMMSFVVKSVSTADARPVQAPTAKASDTGEPSTSKKKGKKKKKKSGKKSKK